MEDQRKVTDFYKVGEVIGSGGFGKVYAGTCKETGISVSWFGCVLFRCDSRICGGRRLMEDVMTTLDSLNKPFVMWEEMSSVSTGIVVPLFPKIWSP